MSRTLFGLLCGLVLCGTARAVGPDAETVTLHFAGSSILDDHGRRDGHYPYWSWGSELEKHAAARVRIRNCARSGRSTRSFRDSGLWKELIDGVRPGDFVAMQFGGNDQKCATEKDRAVRWAPPNGLYRDILRTWIGEVRAKGATPILVSHFSRCTFDADGRHLVDRETSPGVRLRTYCESMRTLAAETGCAFVDMNDLVRARIESLGREEALKNYVISTGFVRSKDGEPAKDTTHPIKTGAEMYAQIFVDEVRRQNLPVAKLFERPERVLRGAVKVGTLRLDGNETVRLEKGAVVECDCVVAENATNVVFVGEGTIRLASGGSVTIRNCRGVRLKDLVLKGTDAVPLRILGSTDVLVRNVTASAPGTDALTLEGSRDVTVEKCRFGRFDEAALRQQAQPSLIRDNALLAFTPNDAGLIGADDSASIQAAVDRAAETGVGQVLIPRGNARTGKDGWTIARAVLLPSDVTVVLDGARLSMADGVYENFFRNANMWTAEGRTLAGEQRGIRILGRNGATLDGAKANDLWEGTSLTDGRPHVRRNVPILMSNVRDFEVSGLRIENHRYWGLCFEYCRNGRISGLVFVARYDRRNQDGVNLRNGCSDISIEDISGQTGDDMVALSAIDRPRTDAYDTTVESKRPDIVRVTIRNIRGAAVGHPLVALRNGNGARLADISVEGVRDSDFIADGDGQDHPRYALIRIGNGMYWTTRPASLGEVANITVRDVVCSRSELGIVINGTLKDSRISDVTCSGPCTAAISTAGPVWGGAGATLENVVLENCRLNGSDDPARAFDAASMSAEDFFRDVTFNGVCVDRAASGRRTRAVRFENVREEYGTYVVDDPSKGPGVIEAEPVRVPVADPLLYWCIKTPGGAALSVEVATAPDCAGRPGAWSAYAEQRNHEVLPLKAGSWFKYRVTLGVSPDGKRKARLHHFKIGDDLHTRWR